MYDIGNEEAANDHLEDHKFRSKYAGLAKYRASLVDHTGKTREGEDERLKSYYDFCYALMGTELSCLAYAEVGGGRPAMDAELFSIIAEQLFEVVDQDKLNDFAKKYEY